MVEEATRAAWCGASRRGIGWAPGDREESGVKDTVTHGQMGSAGHLQGTGGNAMADPADEGYH